MKTSLLIKTIFIVTFLLGFSNIYSQQIDSLKIGDKITIKTIEGETYTGEVVYIDSSNTVLKTKSVEFNILNSSIKKIEIYNYTGKYRYPNFNDTRYFFGASAIPIKKGGGYYQNLLLSSNFVNYGISDNISIGGGVELISLFNGTPLLFLTPKVGFQVANKTHLGAGLLMGVIPNEGAFFLPYGVSTFGSSDSNFTIGGGPAYFGSDIGGAIMFSGMTRVNNSIILLSENYVLLGQESSTYLGIQGIRLLSRKNSFDFGLIIIPGAGIPIPFIGYVRSF